MKNYIFHVFPADGFLEGSFTEKQLAPIKKEIQEIQENFDSSKNNKHNIHLAGQIEREFALSKKNKNRLEKLLLPMVVSYEKETNWISKSPVLSENLNLKLDTAWVNFQKKYEYNPVHHHGGLYSFVIWIKVPYLMEEEFKYSPGKESHSNLSGMFTFHYVNSAGQIYPFHLGIDKLSENKGIVFPSNFRHSVNPFYSSDEYRISVSGNFIFKV